MGAESIDFTAQQNLVIFLQGVIVIIETEEKKKEIFKTYIS